MKISLIVPVYNGERTLRRCLDSVCAQTLTDWECVVINDGSTDATSAILQEYQQDVRLHVETVVNDGVSAAKNRGIELARGEWITFLDCDDYLEPNALQTLLTFGESSGREIVIGHVSVEDEQGTALASAPKAAGASFTMQPAEAAAILFRGSPFAGYLHGKLLRASLVKPLCYATDVHIYEDMLFLLEALAHANGAAYQPTLVHHYIVAGGALAAPLSERKASSLLACEKMLLLVQERFPDALNAARLFAVQNALWFAQEYADCLAVVRRQPWAQVARAEARATAILPCDRKSFTFPQALQLAALRVGWPCFLTLRRCTKSLRTLRH